MRRALKLLVHVVEVRVESAKCTEIAFVRVVEVRDESAKCTETAFVRVVKVRV